MFLKVGNEIQSKMTSRQSFKVYKFLLRLGVTILDHATDSGNDMARCYFRDNLVNESLPTTERVHRMIKLSIRYSNLNNFNSQRILLARICCTDTFN